MWPLTASHLGRFQANVAFFPRYAIFRRVTPMQHLNLTLCRLMRQQVELVLLVKDIANRIDFKVSCTRADTVH